MRMQSVMALFSYVSMLGTFLPLRLYLIPVLLIYAGSYWGVYGCFSINDEPRNEAIFRFFTVYSATILAAIMIQELLRKALQYKDETPPFEKIISEMILVFDTELNPVFITSQARELL